MNSGLDNKQQVAAEFSAAASHYSNFNSMQKQSAGILFDMIGTAKVLDSHTNLLDIGCGPGTDFDAINKPASVFALDIAPGMLAQVVQDFPEYLAVQSDAQALPFQNESFDLIYSNLAMQWCPQLDLVFAEVARVLRSGGHFYGAIVADGSLPELAELGLRFNGFHTLDQIQKDLSQCGWQNVRVERKCLSVYFDDLKALLYSIKGVGASTISPLDQRQAEAKTKTAFQENSMAGVKLRGRQDWQNLLGKAEALRQADGLPLHYEIAFIHAIAK